VLVSRIGNIRRLRLNSLYPCVPTCSVLYFPIVPVVSVMSVDDQSLFNPPVLSGAEPEMAPTHADEEELPGAVQDDGTDGHKGEEVPTTEVTADANAANADHTPTPDVPDHNAMHDPLTMRHPSEILDDDNFDPTSVGEISSPPPTTSILQPGRPLKWPTRPRWLKPSWSWKVTGCMLRVWSGMSNYDVASRARCRRTS
jgi:hypothetical protein